MRRRLTVRGRLAAAFALATAADLGALLAGSHTAHAVAKPLLMPLLAAYAAANRGPRLLLAALLCGWAGDVLLLSDAKPAFLAGMGCFAAGHVCYLALFGRPKRTTAAAYALLWAATLTLLWPGLEPGMRIPVTAYSLLLTAMAAAATTRGPRTAAGGALFLLSDTLIITGAPGFWIMLTYAAAQYALASGLLRYRERTAITI
ncbi:lysoplasmalogenase [Streptomyces sp. NPDC059373]